LDQFATSLRDKDVDGRSLLWMNAHPELYMERMEKELEISMGQVGQLFFAINRLCGDGGGIEHPFEKKPLTHHSA
jgi:hypothetical protein